MTQLTDKAIAYLQRRSIQRVSEKAIHLDDGRAIYLDEGEIEYLNHMLENVTEEQPKQEPPINDIMLSPAKAEEIFFNALCDGMWYFGSYGLEVSYSEADYKQSRSALRQEGHDTPCVEDIYMAMLRSGKEIRLVDTEEGVDDGIWTLDRVHKLVQKAPQHQLLNMLNEEYDAGDADVILQYVAYEDVIFG